MNYSQKGGRMTNRKDSFWKVLACIFLIWAFVFLWGSLIKVNVYQGVLIAKINKLTGNVKFITKESMTISSIIDSVISYVLTLILLGSFVVLIIYTIKAIRSPSKKGM